LPDRTVGDAKAAADEWVRGLSSDLSGFVAAYLCGSVCARKDGDMFKDTSDVDIRVVVEGVVPDPFLYPRHPMAQRKFRFRGVILEPTSVSWDSLRNADVVLADRYLSPPLAHACIVSDPRGVLHTLQRAVSREFSKRYWIRKRCEQSSASAIAVCRLLGTPPPLVVYDPVALNAAYVFIFALIDAALIPILAGLQEPTTRKCLVTSSDTLQRYGWNHLAEKLVRLLGSSELTVHQVAVQLDALQRAFDRAVEVHRTPFYGDFDITEDARAIVMEGARELAASHPREAMHWILFNRIIAQSALMNDAPSGERELHSADFRSLLGMLGVENDDDLLNRAEAIQQALPLLMEAAEDIVARNPNAVD
jgi:hypothetical protein